MLKEKVIAEMKKVFGDDEKRVAHAMRVLGFAEELLLKEPGNHDVVISAALLHDIGIHEAERKYGSNSGKYQEIEGPPIANRILRSLKVKPEVIEEVSDIISHHHSPRKEETLNFKLLYDADLLVNLLEEVSPQKRVTLRPKLPEMFLTSAGSTLADVTLFAAPPEHT